MEVRITKEEYDLIQEYIHAVAYDRPCMSCSLESSACVGCLRKANCEYRLGILRKDHESLFIYLGEYIAASISELAEKDAFVASKIKLEDAEKRKAIARSKFSVIYEEDDDHDNE